MGAALDCQRVADEDLIPRFLRGTLPAAEAERLEEHCFACESCWTQLQAATALSAALAPVPADEAADVDPAPVLTFSAPAQGSSAGRWAGWLSAAAAILLAVGVGSRWLRYEQPAPAPAQHETPAARQESSEPVERGAAVAIAVTVRAREDGAVEIAWAAAPEAASYRVGLFTEDGRETWSRETKELTLAIPAADLAALPQRSRLTLQVEARGIMGANIARSRPERIPAAR